MTKHIFILYFIAGAAFCIALGASFGQRSDYIRLNALGLPEPTFLGLFTGKLPLADNCHYVDAYTATCDAPTGTVVPAGRN